jgi:K+-transporting ATPase ATPase A chain
MIGRTPEYLGKQIGPPEMKLVALYTVLAPVTVLLLTALAVMTDWGKLGLTTNNGAHGFSEILVAYTSAFANNGQNFAGLSANSPFYNLSTAAAMLVGRFGLGVLALALAGHFAQKTRRPSSAGTFATDSPLFGLLLLGTILIIGGLSYLPGLAMGPIVEQLSLYGG